MRLSGRPAAVNRPWWPPRKVTTSRNKSRTTARRIVYPARRQSGCHVRTKQITTVKLLQHQLPNASIPPAPPTAPPAHPFPARLAINLADLADTGTHYPSIAERVVMLYGGRRHQHSALTAAAASVDCQRVPGSIPAQSRLPHCW